MEWLSCKHNILAGFGQHYKVAGCQVQGQEVTKRWLKVGHLTVPAWVRWPVSLFLAIYPTITPLPFIGALYLKMWWGMLQSHGSSHPSISNFLRVPIEKVQLTSCCIDFQRSHEGMISLIICTEARRFIFLQGLKRGTRERDRFNLKLCWPKLAMKHLLYHDILLPIWLKLSIIF